MFSVLRRHSLVVIALLAAACTPVFPLFATLDHASGAGNEIRIVWPTANDAEWPEPGHAIANYEVWVDGALIATPGATTNACRIDGLASATAYLIAVPVVSAGGERGDEFPSLGVLAATVTTPAGSDPGGALACVVEPDTDGDRLPDWAETGTGTFVDPTDTGTDPLLADTDDDGLTDGEEILGTPLGLSLAALGANPLRATVLVEIDWMDDDDECGPHSHRPTPAGIARVQSAFAAAPTANPDGTTGIDLVVDYGQGGVFQGGNLIPDAIAPIGSINGGVSGSEFAAIKAEHFSPVREGYFHYSLHIHRYNTSSDSSGQAEVFGDDLIVSLYCFDVEPFTSSTFMHELGHNLGLRHGGVISTNWKPNYNSIMNYRFQFSGIDAETGPGACDALGDDILDYSRDTRVAIDENAVDESAGVCGTAAVDFNENLAIDPIYAGSINQDIGLDLLEDHADWFALDFGSVDDADGAAPFQRNTTPLSSEQPVPDWVIDAHGHDH
ncbi:MAG: hypothetical protein AAF548_17055 [Actinomycetota bacterium]